MSLISCKIHSIYHRRRFSNRQAYAIDATHFESRDAAKSFEKKKQAQSKKRGRKSNEEKEANQTTYEKEIKHQLETPLKTLWQDGPIDPNWGIKKNSDGKSTFWYGFKGHLAVSTKSQYIVARLITSGNLSDSIGTIPLLKKAHYLSDDQFTSGLFDAGYDYEPIYQQLIRTKCERSFHITPEMKISVQPV